jgi:uncharacterized protein YacL
MFCSTCGAELNKESTFCKHCGAKLLSPIKVEEHQSHLNKLPEVIKYLSITTIAVTLGGFFLIWLLVNMLLSFGVVSSGAGSFMSLIVVLVFSISGLVIRQLSRALSAYFQSDDKGKKMNQAILGEQEAARIDEPPNPSKGITEHTTRRLMDS